jgi:two-component system, NarL family, nitrate/nitrite response regulator NarL
MSTPCANREERATNPGSGPRNSISTHFLEVASVGFSPWILVADGDPASRGRITLLLGRIGYEAEQAQSGREALEAASRRRPALALLEVNLPEVSGYEVCRELHDTFGDEVSVIFLSADRTEPYDRVAGLLLGAVDYIVKPFDPDELLARVRSALRRRPPESGTREQGHSDGSLTARELEVLKLLAHGSNQAEIARTLVISPKTVGTHLQRVLPKLGVHSRAQAVAAAHELGLVDGEGHTASVDLELRDEPSPTYRPRSDLTSSTSASMNGFASGS